MLGDAEAFSSYAVDDLAEAARFYGEVLGLRVSERERPMRMLLLHLAGGRDVLIYARRDHVPAPFTVLNFPVESVGRAVEALAARGVRFEEYDGRVTHGGDGGPEIAWFRDPSGNYLSVIERGSP